MLSLFRTNHVLRSLSLLLYALGVRSFSFLLQDPIEHNHDGMLMSMLSTWISPESWAADIISLLLVFFHATLINRFAIIHRVAQKTTLFPGLFYILFTAFLPSFQYLSPELVSNTFVILLLGQLSVTYKLRSTTVQMFNAGLLCGLAALFQPIYALLLPWSIVALSLYNSVNVRRVLQALIGFAVPLLWYTFIVYLVQDRFLSVGGFFDTWRLLDLGSLESGTHWGAVVLLFVILAWTLFLYRFALIKRVLKSRKAVDMIYWCLFFSGAGAIFQGELNEFNLVWSMVSVSILFSFLFSDTRSSTLAELGHFILFVLLLAINSYHYFLIS